MSYIVCPLCGRYIDVFSNSGICSDCEKLVKKLIEDGTFLLPTELVEFTSNLLPKHMIEIAAIRAGKITAKSRYSRQDIDIAIAVAREFGSTEEKEYVTKIMPHYRMIAEKMRGIDAQRKANADKQRQLAEILASRKQ